MHPGNVESAEQDHFDLLPFIAIMLCLLGALLLVTMSMASISLGAGAGEGWIPGPEKLTKIPILIEWDGTDAVWRKGGARIRESVDADVLPVDGVWYRVRRGENGDILGGVPVPEPPRSRFDELLAGLAANRETSYALIAVRPSGFDSFSRFSERFRGLRIDIGYEPIDQSKPVRLLLPKEVLP